MSYTQGEISKWAKSHGYKISKKDGIFLWNKIENADICGTENSLEELVRVIFNRITDNKWVEHQKKFQS